MLRDVREIRNELLKQTNPETKEVAIEAALTLIKSEEFGNFVSLSTIYNEIEKAK